MSISSKVKMLLAFSEKSQIGLAEQFGMSKQSMNNKMTQDRWFGKDLVKVAEYTGCKLAFVLPDGQHIFIEPEDEKGPDA